MANAQTPLDESFWEAVSLTCDSGSAVLILERWARGAGRTSWFLIQSPAVIENVRRALRHGSEVIAYLHPDLPVTGQPGPELRDAALDLLRNTPRPDEVVGLAHRDGTPELDADFFTGADELEEWLDHVGGRRVWLGKYPTRLDDGPDARTAVVPDADGVVRAHPH